MSQTLSSIVVPVYRTRSVLHELAKQVRQVFREINADYELIFVDDSGDGASWDVLLQLHASDANVKIIRLDQNYGQHNALMCGFRHASGQNIITLDDDLQYSPGDIPRLIRELNESGADVVCGIPQKKLYSHFRKIGSFVYNKLFRMIFRVHSRQKVSSFRVIRKSIVDKILRFERPNPNINILLAKTTEKWGSLIIQHKIRYEGQSFYTFRKLTRFIIAGLIADSPLSIQAALWGLGLVLTGGLIALWGFVTWTFMPEILPGQLLKGVSMTLWILGVAFAFNIFGEYLRQILECIFKKTQYQIYEKHI